MLLGSKKEVPEKQFFGSCAKVSMPFSVVGFTFIFKGFR
jgi:hypothetical protein